MKIIFHAIKLLRRLILSDLYEDINNLKIIQGKILTRQNISNDSNKIQDYEFKVFSQFGDDGIIQYLLSKVSIDPQNRTFVEFGVENYTESNTRFLLINNGWEGMVIDGSIDNINYIKNDPIYWKYQLKAVHGFVTKENINNLILTNGFTGKIGLLHIDIDGNDYWIWNNITVLDPIILILEYNSILGINNSLTIPYNPNFTRNNAHYSNLYWGASLKAFYNSAKSRGYVFLGTNSAGNNAYFVKNEYSSKLKSVSLKTGYTKSKFRESRGKNGKLTYISGQGRIKLISNMPIYDLKKKKILKLKSYVNKI